MPNIRVVRRLGLSASCSVPRRGQDGRPVLTMMPAIRLRSEAMGRWAVSWPVPYMGAGVQIVKIIDVLDALMACNSVRF